MAVTIHRVSFEAIPVLDRWRSVPAAIIADVSKGVCQIDPGIRPLRPAGQQPRLFGRAVTAFCAPPDFGGALRAIDMVGPGEVLVIAAGGNRDTAMIGEILGGQLKRRGAAGLICDGAIRDVGELAGFQGFSVFARHITPRGPSAWETGEVNGVVTFGGRRIAPGDLVIGDDDGLVSLTAGEAEMLIAPAEAKLALEGQWQQDLANGRSVAETFGL